MQLAVINDAKRHNPKMTHIMDRMPVYSGIRVQQREKQMEDMTMVCVQCEEEFEFSVLEQEKYEERGYDIPKRCPTCRKHKYRNLEATEDRRHVNRKRGFSSKHRDEEW